MDPKTLYYVMSVLGPYLESQPYVSQKLQKSDERYIKDSLTRDKQRLLEQIRSMSTQGSIGSMRNHRPPFIVKRQVSWEKLLHFEYPE